MFAFIRHHISALSRIPFVRDVLTLQLGNVAGTGIAFVKSVAFARLLGLELFGLYAVTLAFTGTIGALTNFGQNQATMTFFAESYAKKNVEGMMNVIRYYLLLTLCTGIIIATLIIFSPLVAGLLYPENARTLTVLFQVGLLAVLSGSLNSLFIIVLQTVREIRLMTILENTNLVLQLIFSVGGLLLTGDALGIFIGVFISNVLMLFVYLWSYRHARINYDIPSIRNVWKKKYIPMEYIKQGLWIAADKNLGNVYPQALLFFLSIVASPATVGVAQLALRTGSLPTTILLPHVSRLATTVIPKINEEGLTAVRMACVKIIKHALAVHALVSIGSLIALPVLVLLFYGLPFSAVITPMLWIVVIKLISALNVTNSPIFRLYKKTHIPTLWSLCTLPPLFVVYVFLLESMDPLRAFVIVIAIRQVTNLWLNWYLFRRILR